MGFAEGSANLSGIAEHLNISISTVSRALRGVAGVHPTTRTRVLEAAKAMSRGQAAAPKGSEGVLRTVLVLAQASNPLSLQYYLSGISKASVQGNCSVLSHYLPYSRCGDILESSQQPPAMRQGQIDGILFFHKWPEHVVEQISERYPTVSVIHQYKSAMDRVGIDNESGMLAIVRHLYELGHRKIGFFGLCSEVSWSRVRYGSFVEAMESTGLRFDVDSVVRIGRDVALSEGVVDVGECASEVIRCKQDKGVTAWVSSSDMLCYSLMASLAGRGVRVPQDMSLTGFHAMLDHPINLPLATTVSADSEELGIVALRRLLHRIEDPSESIRTILLSCSLLAGGSTAACPAM